MSKKYFLAANSCSGFISFFEESESRSEMVATFLALLAMAKAKRIHIDGDGDDMSITLLEGGEESIEIDE